MRLYDVSWQDVLVACDAHPGYRSTAWAERLAGGRVRVRFSIIGPTSRRCSPSGGSGTRAVVGASFDGTGYGDDGSTWGGEIFVGSVRDGFARVAHLRPVRMAGGDAAARHPVQAAAGFLEQLDDLPDLTAAPFDFPQRFTQASALLRAGVRVGGQHLDGPALRRGGGAGRLHAADHLRRAGGDLARASGRRGAAATTPARSHSTTASSTSGRCSRTSSRAGWPASRRPRSRGPRTPGIAHGVHAALTALARANTASTPRCSPAVSSRITCCWTICRRWATGGLAAVDQPRRAAQRRRHQPGPGGARGAGASGTTVTRVADVHELSIAMSLVEMATEEAEQRGARVLATHVQARGALGRRERGAACRPIEMASEGTPLEGTALVIDEVPVVIHCAVCDQDRADARLRVVLVRRLRHAGGRGRERP